MIYYIPIKQHSEIFPSDTLQSPLGHHYQVISYLSAETLKINPLDIQLDHEASMEFTIVKQSLISGGWKMKMI